MLVLVRKGQEVFYNGQKLTIVEQATKGPGKEVVKVKGLEGSNGQQWISLSRLSEGKNELECQGREVTTTSRYTLTAEEAARVKELQTELDSIIQAAKDRYVQKPNLNVDPTKMSEAERLAKIEEVKKYYGLK